MNGDCEYQDRPGAVLESIGEKGGCWKVGHMMVVSVVDHPVDPMMKRHGRTLVHSLLLGGVATSCYHVATLFFICSVFLVDVAVGMSVPLPAG